MIFTKYYKLFLVILLIIYFSHESLGQQLSGQSEISVITIGPYQPELYSAFGHSGIRIYDPLNKLDIAFDYGVFDFDQENFFLNFALGKLYYALGLRRFEPWKQRMIQEDRYIIEQKLNLNLQQRQKLFNALKENYKPENRHYYYNYIYDNCATRIPEIIKSSFGDDVAFNHPYVEGDKTYRDLMDMYLDQQPWGDFAIDLGLGVGVDKVATPEGYMFLPDYVQYTLSASTIRLDGSIKPLVKSKNYLHKPLEEDKKERLLTPLNFFILLFFIIGFVTNRNLKKSKRSNLLDVFLFIVLGVVGCFMLFLWFGTQHISYQNYNLLWALPSHLIAGIMLVKKSSPNYLSKYFLVIGILSLASIILWGFWPQPLHRSLIPFVLTICLRSFYIFWDLRYKN